MTPAEKDRRDQELADFRALLQTQPGRRFIARMFAVTHVFQVPFKASSEMAFLLGQQSIGSTLLNDLMTIDVDALPVVIKEHRANEAYLGQLQRKRETK